MPKKKKVKKSKEKDIEIFEVGKEGEEKEIVKESHPKEEHLTKEELKKQHRQLKIILWVLGFLIVFFVLIFVGIKSVRINYYEGVKFETIQEGELILYNTIVPLYDKNGEQVWEYNFYLRTNPNDLKKVPFEGELEFRKGYTINYSNGDFTCEGYGTIAIANLVNQYQLADMLFINDGNATCDGKNSYMYFEMKEGEETKIVQRGENLCYDVYIKDCEVLPAFEKIMAEGFVKFQDMKLLIS
jgi:hypothetical protein